MIISNSMTSIFEDVIREIYDKGQQRGGKGPLEICNFGFQLTDVNNNIPLFNSVDIGYLLAEEIWFNLQDEKLEFINYFKAPGFQRKSEDGIYSNSAYGHIVHQRYGFDQEKQVIDILKKDPTSRRAVINFNVPNPHRGTCFDEICTFNLSFYILDGKLNCTACMRSNDIIGCMPYDVFYFTSIQKRIANELNIPTGYYQHFAISAHCYFKQYKAEILEAIQNPRLPMLIDEKKLLTKSSHLYTQIKNLKHNIVDDMPNDKKLLYLENNNKKLYNLAIVEGIVKVSN